MYQLSTEAIEEFIGLRRDIHRHPELAYEEHRTSALVADKLRQWGYSVTTGLGGTGVVGQLVRGTGKVRIGLRADMDALPIEENNGLAWSSCKPGLMHACGHDGHTAMLLAAAQMLALQTSWSGTLNLIFQPAEEGGGGALRMMQDGLFEQFPCDSIYAMHNMPGFPQGQLVFRNGPTMASSDYMSITLQGQGGHGAMPHRANDPLVAAASLIMALQTVVSRNVDPLQPAVVTVGSIQAGKANNVIPDTAQLEISVRALDPQVRVHMRQRLHELVQLQAQSYGVKAHIDWRDGYAVLVNDAQCTAQALQVARKHFAPEQIVDNGPMLTGSEDFAFMLERVPGCYLFIGNGTGQEPGACMVHNPAYDFNDHNIAIGAQYWVALVNDLLS
ncbi:M20 aminoacylase family protein [Limnohabitans sp.]|uniref:M20 aminoacylase family protein n=1 Tax=Limnohabitans sp. TaxID=1907725 RepID=UPI00311EF5D6